MTFAPVFSSADKARLLPKQQNSSAGFTLALPANQRHNFGDFNN